MSIRILPPFVLHVKYISSRSICLVYTTTSVMVFLFNFLIRIVSDTGKKEEEKEIKINRHHGTTIFRITYRAHVLHTRLRSEPHVHCTYPPASSIAISPTKYRVGKLRTAEVNRVVLENSELLLLLIRCIRQ